VFGGIAAFSGNSNSNQEGQIPKSPERINLDIDDDAILGNPNAPITIIEFSDYECPFCERFWTQTLPQIKSEYINTGKAKFVYRDLPLTSIHPMAQPSAEAAECVRESAGNDEAYFEYHDTLFKNQNLLNKENLILWAQQQGHNINSCLNSNKFALEVNKDLQDGAGAGVTGTPTTFVLMKKENADLNVLINMQLESTQRPGTYIIRYVETNEGLVGLRISGAHPFPTFQTVIESAN
jgi:protein-disulfide isomerase